MFYFCFHGNHSHNLRVNVYSVVSLVISSVKNMISVNTFLQKCSCIVFAKEKTKVWDKKQFFSKKSKRGYT